MATFYVQLENKLLQISGELTAENISKALGYVPVSPNVTNELSQRVDNISFDTLKDNPFLQDGSGELNIVDEAGNIIAKINADGIHSVDFIAGEHKLSNKADKTYVDEVVKNGKIDLTGYATEEYVNNIDFYNINNNPIVDGEENSLTLVDENGNIGLKVTEDGLHVKDVIAGNHKLTDKIDSSALNGYATEEWVENKNYLTEHQDISHLATKDEVSNINFYNIKDNPIVNNGDGKLLFVDENGYIGLQLEEDGLYVKDVIADGHTLSQKADKSELSNYATKDEVSDLVDMSVVTELQGKVNTLINTDTDKSVRDIAVDVLTETLVSETATDAYDTLAEMSAWIKSHPEDASAMNTAIQKNADDIINTLTSAKSYTDETIADIDFYNIKNNPIVNSEDGTLTFVDESGYIGLKVTEDGLVVKDVVTPEHTLSSKADKSFVEDNYYNKTIVDKKITDAVTNGIDLDGYATEQWVNEQNFLKEHQDITHLAEKSELPTKTSDLTNDSGFITINDIPEVTVPTKVSELENDSKFITIDEVPEVTVPTKTSDLTNDSGFITINDVPEVTVPTKTSDLTNDSGFITLSDVPVLEIPEEYVTDDELSQKGFLVGKETSEELDDIETNTYVKYVEQTLTEEQKAQARNNIGITFQEKKKLSILFVGNSLTQDGIAYLPYILKTYYPEIDFHIYMWYIGGKTLGDHYSNFTSSGKADIFSVAENSPSWTNYSKNTTMANVLLTYKFDIVCMQEYFNYKTSYENCTDWNNCRDYIRTNYKGGNALEFISLFHAPLRKDGYDVHEVYKRTEAGNALILQSTISDDLIPNGIAVYRALETDLNNLGDLGQLSPDGTHTQEGLPCLLQTWVTLC